MPTPADQKISSLRSPMNPQTSQDNQSKQAKIFSPSIPVIVNPKESSMHTPTASGFLKKQKPTPAPSADSFSFTSILNSLTDDAAQADINAIAEIYGKSSLSMANHYSSHRMPIGPGIPVGDDDNSDGTQQSDTDIEVTALSSNLETVEEAASPSSEHSSLETVLDQTGMLGRGLISMSQAGQYSLGLSSGAASHTETHTVPGSFTTKALSDLRDNVSGSEAFKHLKQIKTNSRR